MNIFDFFRKKSTEDPDVINASTVNERKEEQDPAEKHEKKSDNLKSKFATKSKKHANDKRRVHNLLILDESGSMQSIYQPALTGVNETLQTIREAQKEHTNQIHFVSLITFDSYHYNQIYNNTPAKKAINITPDQYRPCGCTPLFDAMGRSITELLDVAGKNDVVLVTIITDGYENASREYNGKAIKALVEAMKSRGWVFTYIGANQDVEAVANAMSIDNHLCFEASQTGARDMFEKENRCRKKFFSKIKLNQRMSNFCLDYFDEDD